MNQVFTSEDEGLKPALPSYGATEFNLYSPTGFGFDFPALVPLQHLTREAQVVAVQVAFESKF
jgi:hypothetical protein